MIYTIKNKLILAIAAFLLTGFAVTSCSDDPDESNYYTFTGEMMGQYIQNREEYSDFTEIVTRAGLMDLLNSYGAYTCFVPNNEAVQAYLQKKGKSSLSDLSKEDCDTIAYTHIVNNLYTTSDMNDGVITTANLNKRFLEVTHSTDEDNNPIVVLNNASNIIFSLQDDSVENGIMQPITAVLESSNQMVADTLEHISDASLFFEALTATGMKDSLYKYMDETWDYTKYENVRYTSNGMHNEIGWIPEQRLFGYTLFVEPNSVFEANGITTLRQMYDKACELYAEQYSDDVNQSYWSFDSLTHRSNPLNRFISYHILNRNAIGANYLTPLNDIGIVTGRMNPEDWYETMLSHTMMNIQKVTVRSYQGAAALNSLKINRRYDSNYQIEGVTINTTNPVSAVNGIIFYIDGLLAFDKQTSDIVQNRRIRMDLSTVFPELMTNGIRQNGNPDKDDETDYDDKKTYGANYAFPNGYLENVTVNGGDLIYRRPRRGYWSYEGDEFNVKGDDYDVTFRIPPVPVSGMYQIRLGYCATDARGIAQIYFDGEPQGIPLDMRIMLNNSKMLGTKWDTYENLTESERNEINKFLKNKGYYRGARGAYHGTEVSNTFYNQYRTFRIVIATVNIRAGEDHYIRLKNVSKAENPEMMIDYIEIVPRSVYGISDSGAGEDDL